MSTDYIMYQPIFALNLTNVSEVPSLSQEPWVNKKVFKVWKTWTLH